MRWVVFITVFFIGIFSCFWCYTWNHREEFVQMAFSRLYPAYAVSVGSLSLDTDGTVTMNDILFFPKKNAGQSHFSVAQIEARASLSAWLQWVVLPSTTPLHLSSLSIQGSTTVLPSDVATPAKKFVQIDSLTIEKSQP